MRGLLSALCAVSVLTPAGAVRATDPVVSVWYRGTPAGTPRADDLAAIRATGFTSVTWPIAATAGAAELHRLADIVGLSVVVRSASTPLTDTTALEPGEFVDIVAPNLTPAQVPGLAWRAIAHGARVLSFDGGQQTGTGLADTGGAIRPWVEPARAVARQLSFNGRFVIDLKPAGSVKVDGAAPPAFDVALLQDSRSWVLIATNTSKGSVKAVAHLPAGVPAALWSDLIEGTPMSMLNQPGGAVWSLTLAAGGARVYVVDKK